jgi:hypothetical protein
MKEMPLYIMIMVLFVNIYITGFLIDYLKTPFLYKTLRMIGSFELIIYGIFFIYYWFTKNIDIAGGSGIFMALCCLSMITLASILESFEKKIKKAEQKNSRDAVPSPQI